MKCREAVQWLVEPEIDKFPVDVREHIEKCATCREAYEANRFAARIIALKRYECPAQDVAERLGAEIRMKISGASDANLARFMFSDCKYYIKPVAQFAAAAAFIVLIGSFFFKQNFVFDRETRHPVEVEDSRVDAESMQNSQPKWMIEHTNSYPSDIQYGSWRSRVVDFEGLNGE